MGRPKKKISYCHTAEDVQREKEQKEASRRAKIAATLAARRADERAHREAAKLKSGAFLLDQLVNELEALVVKADEDRIKSTKR